MNGKCWWLVVGLAALGCGADGAAREEQSAPADGEVYSSPPGVELAFRTTVPPGIRVQTTPSESGGDAVRFVAEPEPDGGDAAFLHFFVSPAGITGDAAREVVQAAAESYRVPGNRTEVQPLPPPPWAVVKYRVQSRGARGEPVTGWVALGQHGGRWFHVLVQQPESLEESFAPKVEQILEAWRWVDDGQGLRAEAVQ